MPSTAAKKGAERKMSLINVSTKSKYNVQHRSDLLMDEHVRNVRQAQFEFQSAMQELDSNKTPEEMETLRAEAAELKARSEKLVLILQVMGKINTELSYARADLNDALHKGIGDINAARKRVIWLEDKMGELCGKKRLKSRRPSNRFVSDRMHGWDTDSDGDQTRRLAPLDSALEHASDQARHQSLTQLLGSEIGFTSDSEHFMNRQVGFPDMSSQSYDSQDVSFQAGNKGVVSSQEDVSTVGAESGVAVRVLDHRKSLHDSMASLTSGGHGEIVEESGSEKFSVVKEVSVAGVSPYQVETPDGGKAYDEDAEEEQEKPVSQEGVLGKEKHTEQEEETDQGPGEDFQRMFSSRTPVSVESGRAGFEPEEEEGEEEDDGDESDDEEEDDDEEESDSDSPKGEELENEDEKAKKTFLTEVGGEGQPAIGSKVTLRSPGEAETEKNEEEPPSHRDIGTEYWQSEHHRFEFSEFADIFTEVDPLSYHQMGLAVPGSFVKKEDTETEFSELPWRARRKGSDIKDIHRVALDKLAARVHGLYDKVYSATMLSVKPSQLEGGLPRETSMFHSLDSSKMLKPGSSSSKSSGPPQTAPASLRQRTEDKLPLPMAGEVKRGGTFVAGRLIFYPKPIPPPQVLPITRTSLNKEYPQFASSFSHPDPDVRKPAERLVDQRNLMEETKLVLYREKIKPSTPGPTHLERKFRKMIEHDGTLSNKSSGHSKEKKIDRDSLRKRMKTSFKAAAVMAKFQGGVSNWNQIKPQSRGKEYSGLRWERVKTIVHMNLRSDRTEERMDAAKQLGLLRCGDTMVFFALKERLASDPDKRVKYEATKALILVGCWEDDVIQAVLKFMVLGNTEVRTDLIDTLIQGKNVQYVDKSIPSFLELVKVLSHFCRNPDPEDLIAFNSAVCLGRLCVKDESAQARLVKAMEEDKDTHVKAKALEILVKQLHFIDDNVVEHVMELLRESSVWKYRALACRLLISLGPTHKCVADKEEAIYLLLENKLWDDPNMDVRLAAAKALTALGMFARACESVERKLEDTEEDARAQAAISVGTLGMRSEKLIRLLLEMIELDASDYVRLMIIRTFAVLKLTDKRILRCLREREKLEGSLARESGKALKVLDGVKTGHVSKSWSASVMKQPLHTRRVLSPILAGAV